MNRRFQKSFAIAAPVASTVLSFGSVYPPVTQSNSLPGMNETRRLMNRTFNNVVAHDEVDNDGDDDRGRIAFVSTRGGNSDIYVMRPDASGLVNLTNHPASLVIRWKQDRLSEHP